MHYQETDMSAGISTDRELRRLSRRFVSETSAFLSDNWCVERRWWPLRDGCAGGTAISTCGAGAEPPRVRVQTVGPDDFGLVHFLSPASEADGAALAETHLFVAVPLTRSPVPGAAFPEAIVQDPQEKEQWPIWVPDTAAPRRAASRPPVRVPVAR